MTVSVQLPVITYTANGSSTVFNFPYLLIVETDMKVYFNNLPVATGFVVSGIGSEVGGAVTFAEAPPAGTLVKLLRSIPLNRTTDYVEGGALRANVLDSDIDRVVMQLQDVRADAASLVEFAALLDETRENIDNIEANAAAAAASAAAALVSEGNADTSEAAAAASAAAALDSQNSATSSAATATTQAGVSTTQAGIATTQASTATTQAGIATAQADIATTQATSASGSAATATTQAGIATTQAGIATSQAASATSSAAAAAASAASVDADNIVSLTGAQTVTGAKTFSSIAVPTQTAGNSATDAASTAFVDRVRGLSASASGTGSGAALEVGDRGSLKQLTLNATIPTSIFAAGDVVTLYNNSASNITLTQQAGLTLRLVGTSSTGNRTLAPRGLVTIVFVSATEAIASGGGLS